MPRDFTLDKYKTALKELGNKKARAGWEYLVARGVAESEIIDAIRIAVSLGSETWRKAWQKSRVTPAKVRAMAKQLEKQTCLLEKVLVQYPEIFPTHAEGLFRLSCKLTQSTREENFERTKRIRLEMRDIPAILHALAERLAKCRGKRSDTGKATVRRGRLAQGPEIDAVMTLLNLFWKAEAGLCEPGFSLPLRTRGGATAPPPKFKNPPAKAPFVWTAELLNLACRLAKRPDMYSPDGLRKMQEERSFQKFLLHT